ncbi:MAG: hypothetical protein ACRDNL_03560, partial [Spirillospora sp.]
AEIARRRTAAENPPMPRPLLEPPLPLEPSPLPSAHQPWPAQHAPYGRQAQYGQQAQYGPSSGARPLNGGGWGLEDGPFAPHATMNPAQAGQRRPLLLAAVAAVALLVTIGVPAGIWFAARDDGGGAAAAPSTSPTSTASAAASASPTGSRGELTFSIEGGGRVSLITYMFNGKTTRLKNVKLPWKKTLQIPSWPPRIPWKLAYTSPAGGSSDSVAVDGQVIIRGQGSSGTDMRSEGVL